LEGELVSQLKQLGKANGCSFMTTLLSGFEVFLYRLTGQADLTVGISAAGQLAAEQYSLVGHCVNLLPLRTQVDPQQSFQTYLQQRQSALLDAYDRQQFTFGSLVKRLALSRDASRIPLVPITFNLDQALDPKQLRFEGLEATLASNPRTFENFEIFINATEAQGQLTLECQYNTNLFQRETIQRRLAELETLLRGVVQDPQQAIAQLPLLPESEHTLLVQWCQQSEPQDIDLPIHQKFEQWASQTPTAVALSTADQPLTYAELNAQANQLARHLQAQGTGPNALVGICVPRSPLMIISLISILKVGAAYVPIDPEYPAERQQYMVTDSGIDLLLYSTHNQETDLYTSAPRMSLEDTWPALTEYSADNLQIDVSGEQLAYVIYTSGSTGRPKGVQIKHQGLSNYLSHACANYYEKAQGGVVSSPLAFDATITSLLGPLYCGKTVVLLPPYRNEIESIIGHIKTASEVWVFKVTPAHIEAISQLVGSACLSHLSHVVVVGGEQFTAQAAHYFKETLLPAAVLVNEYGPTETVVGCSTYEVKKYQDIPKNRLFIPIGKPIQNTQLYVLSLTQQLCPIGVPGELFIGGYGVAQGYHQRLDLSKIKFVDNPFEPSEKLYRTGDKVQWLPNGNLEFLGRVDDQIKLRGFRIEPGEVEAAINNHPAIQQSLVMAREDTPGDKRLVAYTVQIPEADVPLGDLRTFLKSRLPDYMMPSALVTLDALPLTPSGKVDRKVLPPPKNTSAATFVPAEGEVEATLARIWGEVLGVFQVSRHDPCWRCRL
jgi:amino acid adenylation domain-containing protein